MTARAHRLEDPDAQLRNPDDFAIKFLGPREQAILPEYPWNLLDLGFEAAMKAAGGPLPIRRMALQTRTFDALLLEALRQGARQVVMLGAGFDSRGYRSGPSFVVCGS